MPRAARINLVRHIKAIDHKATVATNNISLPMIFQKLSLATFRARSAPKSNVVPGGIMHSARGIVDW